MRTEHSIPGPGHNPHAEALQACVSEALNEAPGLASRWVARLGDVLKQQGAWAANSREKAGTDLKRSGLNTGAEPSGRHFKGVEMVSKRADR
jgi:hypothetical protein